MTLLFSSVLHFLLLLKIYRIVTFFGKIYWSMNSESRWAGNCQVYKKKYFHFQNLTKNCNTVWKVLKSFVTIFCRFLKRKIIFLDILRNTDLLKVIFFARSEFSLIKFCAKLCTKIAIKTCNIWKKHSQIVPKIRKTACFASSAFKSISFGQILESFASASACPCVLKALQKSPAHRGPEFIDQSIFQKKLTILYIFKKDRSAKLKRREGSRRKLVTYLFFLKIYRNINFFGKVDWSINSGQQCVGDCQGYLKKIFSFFQNATKMVTKLGQFTKLGPFSTFQLFKLPKLCYHFLLRFEN